MPMLADLDHPPRPRGRDLLIGALCGLPIVGLVLWLVLPRLMASVLGGAGDFDQRLRLEDAYMQAVCSEAFQVGRDEKLCGCVLAVEFPALDCRQPFLLWSLARHHTACADPQRQREALTFCSCIDTLAGRVLAPDANLDERGADIQRVGKCLELPDAFPLPELSELTPQEP